MGIQVSGLLSNSAFDWKSVVDQLVAADGIPIKNFNAEKGTNSDQMTALTSLRTSLTDLQDSIQSIRSESTFDARAVTSSLAGTTWKSNSANGAAVGTYKFAVQQLATASLVSGAGDIGQGLSTSTDVSGLTLANLRTGTLISAGTFTVSGQQVTIALTDSLQDVFDKISTATGGDVTAAYDPASDRVTLTSGSGNPIVLGASNDTSNFLAAAKLSNNGASSVGSSGALGTVKLTATLATAGLRTAITAVDSAGKGSFTLNGVSIAYNINSDSLSSLMSRINSSDAGVSATYDPLADRVVLTNKTTGDVGLGMNEASGGLLGALGLTGTSGTLARGKDALFRVNDGAVLSSHSNTLDESAHGIDGLSVTVDTNTTQTLTIASDASSMQTAMQTFIDKFNAVQDFIETNTKVTVDGTNVSTAVLSKNREIQDWARQLQSMAFASVSGLTGSVDHISDLGIDFDSTTGHLKIKNADKLATALTDHPDDVKDFFLSTNGLGTTMFGALNGLVKAGSSQVDALNKANSALDKQISDLQARLDNEREQLTNSFIEMLDAQSKAQSQTTYLTNTFFKSSSN